MIVDCYDRGSETPNPKVNAAILAHAFNVLLEVVEFYKTTVILLEIINGSYLKETAPWNEEIRLAKAVLAKASTVEIPE